MVTTQLHTAADLEQLATSEQDFELIEGELIVVSPTSYEHGVIQSNLARLLGNHVQPRGLGNVSTESGFVFSKDPDTVLGPDVAFVSSGRIPTATPAFPELAPDLVVEIVSTSNSPGEIERKIAIYLKSGVQQTWIVYPPARKVVVNSPSGPPRVYSNLDKIDGGELLPDLVLPVDDIFV